MALQTGYEMCTACRDVSFVDTIIRKAFAEQWVLITNDKDFGEKVYRDQCHHGVILLRLEDNRVYAQDRGADRGCLHNDADADWPSNMWL